MNGISPDSAPGVLAEAVGLTPAGSGHKLSFFQSGSAERQHITKDETATRDPHRAVGMVRGSMAQVQVARELGIDVAMIGRCWPATDQERHSRTAQVEAGSQP